MIAEGVETAEELEVFREADVDLVQGYLLARPGVPWPQLEDHSAPRSTGGGSVPGPAPAGQSRLIEALERSPDARRACAAVVEHLFRQGQIMPSAYLERHGELRCTAQRGLWQILDGMSGSSGITGRTWKTGRPTVVPDVAKNPAYLEAIPGVVSEICVPITVGERAVGALNVESLTRLPAGMLDELERCADLLAARLKVDRGPLEESSWDRTVHASVVLSGIGDTPQLPDLVLGCLLDASLMDSGALILDGSRRARGGGGRRALGCGHGGADPVGVLLALLAGERRPVLLHGK